MSVNVPVTQWTSNNGTNELVVTGTALVIDELANFLVDELGNDVVDTGIDFKTEPATIWTENDGI